MSEIIEDIVRPVEDDEYVHPLKKEDIEGVTIPVASKPGVEYDGGEAVAELTSYPSTDPQPDWNETLKEMGYDPEYYEILEPIKASMWDTQSKDGTVQRMYSYKVGVRTKTGVADVDYEELVDQIKKHKKHKPAMIESDGTLLVLVADTQIGKPDGDGTTGIVQRFCEAVDSVEARIRELRLIGRGVNKVCVAFMGDLIENCEGSYQSQAFSVEWNRRQQVRIVRRLARNLIVRVATLVDEVDVIAVPGNHGENKSGHRVFTSPGDNDDVAVIESVADILSFNREAYGHVRFIIPEDEIYVVHDLSGKRVCFSHGHISGSGSSPQLRQKDWWKNQIFGDTPAGQADYLFTAHYHHFSINEHNASRIHFQCPSLESESTWWVNLKGEKSPPGILTVLITEDGHQDIQVV